MKNFLSRFKTWAHVAAGFIATAVGLYVANPTIHNAVNGLVSPKAAAIIGGLATIVLTYSNSQKAQ